MLVCMHYAQCHDNEEFNIFFWDTKDVQTPPTVNPVFKRMKPELTSNLYRVFYRKAAPFMGRIGYKILRLHHTTNTICKQL